MGPLPYYSKALRLELIMEMAGMQVMPLPFSFPLLLMALEPELQLAI
jgi:hypothetical protein